MVPWPQTSVFPPLATMSSRGIDVPDDHERSQDVEWAEEEIVFRERRRPCGDSDRSRR